MDTIKHTLLNIKININKTSACPLSHRAPGTSHLADWEEWPVNSERPPSTPSCSGRSGPEGTHGLGQLEANGADGKCTVLGHLWDGGWEATRYPKNTGYLPPQRLHPNAYSARAESSGPVLKLKLKLDVCMLTGAR